MSNDKVRIGELNLLLDEREATIATLRADLARVTAERDEAQKQRDTYDEWLSKEIEAKEHREKEIERFACALGCDEEWSSLHDHGQCVADAIQRVKAERDAAKADADEARKALEANKLRPFQRRAADALADEVAVLVKRKVIDSRSPVADALLDYRDPPTSPRADRIEAAESDLATERAAKERAEALLREGCRLDPATGADLETSIDEDPKADSSIEALVNWVAAELRRCEEKGSIFDTGFRCVSEGGTLWYFDPEELANVWKWANAAMAHEKRATAAESRSEKLAGLLREARETLSAATETGVAVECVVCHHQKAPQGRSAPLGPSYCDHECPGYRQEPHVGSLWPGETRADFGYPEHFAQRDAAFRARIVEIDAALRADAATGEAAPACQTCAFERSTGTIEPAENHQVQCARATSADDANDDPEAARTTRTRARGPLEPRDPDDAHRCVRCRNCWSPSAPYCPSTPPPSPEGK